MPYMAAKKKGPGRPKAPPRVAVQIRIHPDMARALEALALRNRRGRTDELAAALEEKLRAEGLWPPRQT